MTVGIVMCGLLSRAGRRLAALALVALLGGCGWQAAAPARPMASLGGAAGAEPARLLDDGITAAFHGPVTFESAALLLRLLQAQPQVSRLRLDSEGGYLVPALRLAALLQPLRLATYVEGECLSACTLLFLSGRERILAGGSLGFHRGWQEGETVESPATQDSNRAMRRRLLQRGVAAAFVERVLATPGEAMWYPSAQELLDGGVVTALSPPAAGPGRY